MFDASHNSPKEAGCYRWGNHMAGTLGAFEHMQQRAGVVQPCLIREGEGSCYCIQDADPVYNENQCLRAGSVGSCTHSVEEIPECATGYLPMRGSQVGPDVYETLCRAETGSGGYLGTGYVAYGGDAPYFNQGPPITLAEYESKAALHNIAW